MSNTKQTPKKALVRRDPSTRVGLSWSTEAPRAKQSFAREVDINTIVQRYLSTGQIPPATSAPVYADMTKVPATLQDAMVALRSAQSLISKLPVSVRQAFERDPLGMLDRLQRAQAGGPGASGAVPGPGSKPTNPDDKSGPTPTAPAKAAPGGPGPQAGG